MWVSPGRKPTRVCRRRRRRLGDGWCPVAWSGGSLGVRALDEPAARVDRTHSVNCLNICLFTLSIMPRPNWRDASDDIDVGDDAHLGATVCEPNYRAGHRHPRRPGAAALASFTRHLDDAVRVIALSEDHLAGVRGRNRSDLHLHPAKKRRVVLNGRELGARKTVHDLSRIGRGMTIHDRDAPESRTPLRFGSPSCLRSCDQRSLTPGNRETL